MEIRRLRSTDDRLAVSQIYEESWKYAYRGIIPQSYLDSIPQGKWASHLEQSGMHSLVAVEDSIYLGTASCCASRFPDMDGCGEIVSLYLRPEYMGKGYGKALLTAALDELASIGYHSVFLWVLEENARARQFYENHGFVYSGEFLQDEIGGKLLRELRYCYTIG